MGHHYRERHTEADTAPAQEQEPEISPVTGKPKRKYTKRGTTTKTTTTKAKT